MPLPDNQFFEVEWRQHSSSNAPHEYKGIVLDWAAPYGATATSIIMREDMKVVKVNTDQLKVRGIIDVTKSGRARPAIPVRQIVLRGSEA